MYMDTYHMYCDIPMNMSTIMYINLRILYIYMICSIQCIYLVNLTPRRSQSRCVKNRRPHCAAQAVRHTQGLATGSHGWKLPGKRVKLWKKLPIYSGFTHQKW